MTWRQLLFIWSFINVREYRRDNPKWTMQRQWQHWVHKTQDEDKQNKKHNTICVRNHCIQSNTNIVNKTWALQQITGGKDEPNIIFIWFYMHYLKHQSKYCMQRLEHKLKVNIEIEQYMTVNFKKARRRLWFIVPKESVKINQRSTYMTIQWPKEKMKKDDQWLSK